MRQKIELVEIVRRRWRGLPRCFVLIQHRFFMTAMDRSTLDSRCDFRLWQIYKTEISDYKILRFRLWKFSIPAQPSGVNIYTKDRRWVLVIEYIPYSRVC